ncbi:hypothetical protein ACVW2L_001428 [Mucilaginibacter sp. HD30]
MQFIKNRNSLDECEVKDFKQERAGVNTSPFITRGFSSNLFFKPIGYY